MVIHLISANAHYGVNALISNSSVAECGIKINAIWPKSAGSTLPIHSSALRFFEDMLCHNVDIANLMLGHHEVLERLDPPKRDEVNLGIGVGSSVLSVIHEPTR